MRYTVTIQKTDEGYSVWVPGLPGCWSQGSSEEEALENIEEAIKDYIHVRDMLSAEKEVRYVEVAHA